MRGSRPGTALALALLASPVASAQVTVNPGALDLLPAPKPQAAPRPARPPARPAPRTAARPGPAAPAQPAAPAPATPPPPAEASRPALPTTPPAVAALPPPPPMPPPRQQPTPVVPIAADAPGTAAPMPGGVRVTFGADRQDLNPVTEAAIRGVARGLKDPAAAINIYAYAAGVPEDPSTSRRLSLARALAARAVLINEGVASTRIYPRALGPTGGAAAPDRVDVVAGPPGPPPAASVPGNAPASAPGSAP